MKNILLLFLSLIVGFQALAQATINPDPAVANKAVTITYNASQGTTSLVGAAKVYLHAGVVTNKSATGTEWRHVKGNWGADDGIGQMTKVNGTSDTWQITLSPDVRSYFNVPDDEKILKIGMVFRNADGTKEGKSPTNSDIFADVFDGFSLILNSPTETTFFATAGETISIAAQASNSANITLYANGEEVTTQFNTTSFSYNYVVSGHESTLLYLVARSEADTADVKITILARVNSPTAPLPSGLKDGLNKRSTTEATFVVTAKDKSSVYLVGDFTNWKPSAQYLMKRDGDKFWLNVLGLSTGNHSYYYLVDQEIDIIDPYSTLVLDRNEDKYIEQVRFPDLPSFPEQATVDYVTYFNLAADTYTWTDQDFIKPKKEDLIIYELLVRDFSEESSFQGVLDKLDYLDSLNITAIQLMPVMEFKGNDSWGYNPYAQNALDKYYGSPAKFKELVDKAHQRGIAIILDIALNHQDYPAPFLKMWWAGSTATSVNPYFNQAAKHPANVFTDVNHESSLTQDWVDHITKFWIEEYHIDGYRFDLSKGFTQTYSDNYDAWARKDNGRIALLNRMANRIWAIDSNAYVILEHFANNDEEIELANAGMMLWGNFNHNFGEAILGYNLTNSGSDFSWLSYKNRGWSQPNLIGYLESHDEERQLYKALNYGNSSGSYDVRQLATALQRTKLAHAFLLLTPGPKMLWQFGEFGYDIPINACADGQLPPSTDPEPYKCRTSRKPLNWDYLNNESRADLFKTISELNKIKATLPVFETSNFTMPGQTEVRQLTLKGNAEDAILIGNFGLTEKAYEINFTHSGTWYSYFSNEQINVGSSAKQSISIQPGGFYLFLDAPQAALNNYTASSLGVLPAISFSVGTAVDDTLRLEVGTLTQAIVTTAYLADLTIHANGQRVATGSGKALLYNLNSSVEDTIVIEGNAKRNGVTTTNKLVVIYSKPLGIENKTLSKSIKLYPVPASTELRVELAAGTNVVSVLVTNIVGSRVKVPRLIQHGNGFSVTTANLPSGLYFIEIVTPDGKAIKRFTKK